MHINGNNDNNEDYFVTFSTAKAVTHKVNNLRAKHGLFSVQASLAARNKNASIAAPINERYIMLQHKQSSEATHLILMCNINCADQQDWKDALKRGGIEANWVSSYPETPFIIVCPIVKKDSTNSKR